MDLTYKQMLNYAQNFLPPVGVTPKTITITDEGDTVKIEMVTDRNEQVTMWFQKDTTMICYGDEDTLDD